jgi:hypothetical protein
MMADLRWLALMVCCAAPLAQATDDLESLDADFLSYLAEFEGEDDDWTIVEPSMRAKPVLPAAAKSPPPRKPEPVTNSPPSKPAAESGSEQ